MLRETQKATTKGRLLSSRRGRPPARHARFRFLGGRCPACATESCSRRRESPRGCPECSSKGERDDELALPTEAKTHPVIPLAQGHPKQPARSSGLLSTPSKQTRQVADLGVENAGPPLSQATMVHSHERPSVYRQEQCQALSGVSCKCHAGAPTASPPPSLSAFSLPAHYNSLPKPTYLCMTLLSSLGQGIGKGGVPPHVRIRSRIEAPKNCILAEPPKAPLCCTPKFRELRYTAWHSLRYSS